VVMEVVVMMVVLMVVVVMVVVIVMVVAVLVMVVMEVVVMMVVLLLESEYHIPGLESTFSYDIFYWNSANIHPSPSYASQRAIQTHIICSIISELIC